LYRHLPKARRRRGSRHGRRPRGASIPRERWIENRPTEIETRETFGHWEADLLIFRKEHGKANVTSLMERTSRFTFLLANEDKRSAAVVAGVADALRPLPEDARRTVTFDRGTEFAAYRELARELDVASYSYEGEPRQASTACCLHRGLPWGSGTGLSRPCRTIAGTNSYAVALGADPDNANVDTGGEFGGALIGAAVRLFSGADERREEEPNVVAPG
jgi:hypothetical protein